MAASGDKEPAIPHGTEKRAEIPSASFREDWRLAIIMLGRRRQLPVLAGHAARQ